MKKSIVYMAAFVAVAVVSGNALASSCSGKMETSATKHSHKDIVAVAAGAGQFSTLVAAVKAADLVDTLQGEGPFTVFAPTDEAFARLPEGTVAELLKPENKDKLVAILKHHVVLGRVMAADVKPMAAKTAAGDKLQLNLKDGTVLVASAKVIKADIEASNGVIHVIDAVVIPNS
jgi:uncharacterized surface protein with fasciclin (FAS1) repeats